MESSQDEQMLSGERKLTLSVDASISSEMDAPLPDHEIYIPSTALITAIKSEIAVEDDSHGSNVVFTTTQKATYSAKHSSQEHEANALDYSFKVS